MLKPINDKRFVFTDEAREEACAKYGETVSLSVLAIADTNRDFVIYAPVALTDKNEEVLVEPFFRTYPDMIREAE